MGRPRRPYNGVEDITPLAKPFAQGQLPGRLGVRQRREWERSTHDRYPQVNGLYDPMTYMFLLDAVVGINPDIELRTAKLVGWLNWNSGRPERSTFYWDVITVGKVLADIAEYFEDVLGPKMGLLEAGRDYKGAFYRIHHNDETLGLYVRVRAELFDLVKAEKALRLRGERGERLMSPLQECPSLRVGDVLAEVI